MTGENGSFTIMLSENGSFTIMLSEKDLGGSGMNHL